MWLRLARRTEANAGYSRILLNLVTAMRPKTSRNLNNPVPEFSSLVEEEAAFWDTHSLADFWDDSEPVSTAGGSASESVMFRNR